jgi:predicted acylesterase/phospholipase RssA
MKLGVVLPGGGAAGAVQHGMLRALIKSGIEPSAMFCTSAGSLNGFGLSHLGDIDEVTKVWRGVRGERDIFSGNYWVKLPWVTGKKNAEPLRKLLKSIQARGEPKIPFTVTTVSLLTGEVRNTPHTDPDIVNMTVASASIPGYVECYQPETFAWADGGIKQNLNLAAAIAARCDVIVCLHCYPEDPRRGDGWKVGNPIHNGLRAISLATEENYKNDRNICFAPPESAPIVIDVRPEAKIIDVLDFKPRLIDEAIRYGEQSFSRYESEIKAAIDARAAIQKLVL